MRIRIGTRKSKLALWQADYVHIELLRHHRKSELEIVLCKMLSEGDKIPDVPLSVIGGKGLFLKDLEQAMLRGEIDIAVHSMKDVTVTMPDGLCIGAICEREDPRDAFVSNRFASLSELPDGARIGTCSLRRQCQLRAHFPHLYLANLRGNIGTRLAKLDSGEFDGIVLAVAGLKRLQLSQRITEYLPPEMCLPAVGQGAIGIECRADDSAMIERLAPLNHADSALCIQAERALNERLGGGCHVPIAAYATLSGDVITLRALVGTVDGTKLLRCEKKGKRAEATLIGHAAAEELLAAGAAEVLDRVDRSGF